MKWIERIVIVLLLLAVFFLYRENKNLKETLVDPKDYFSRQKVAQLAKDYNVSMSFLRTLFSDKTVYYDDQGQIVFEDKRNGLKEHEYNWNYLQKDENGQMNYTYTARPTYQGVDVSKFSKEIDWAKVKEQGIYFAMLRAGYRGYETGYLNKDAYFERNIQQATANGIKVGVYFFSQAINEQEAIEEADYVLDLIKDYDVSFPVVYDLEEVEDGEGRANGLKKEQETLVTRAFCERIEEAGYIPMIYGGSHKLLGKLDMEQLQQYDVWYAQYASRPYYPYQFTIWQYTESGILEGIEGDVDRNISFVDYSTYMR